MILKIRSIAFMLFLTILISGVVYCDEIRMPPDTANVYGYGEGRLNLIIGGIGQDDPTGSDANQNYKDIADDLNAMYIYTYNSGKTNDIAAVNAAASCDGTYFKTPQNGLTNTVLGGTDLPQKYNTIVAYSGGTVTAVTALDKQDVSCDTLILISPMIGVFPGAAKTLDFPNAYETASPGIEKGQYEDQIKRILRDGKVQRILVIQSDDDQLFGGNYYQYKFKEGKITGVEVEDVDLEKLYSDQAISQDRSTSDTSENAMSTVPIIYTYDGEQAHKDLFFKYAKENLKANNNGEIYYVPTQPVLNQECNAFKKPSLTEVLGLRNPLLSPTSGASGFCSAQNVPETSGATYFDQANDVWYIDAYSWTGSKSLYEKPAAPRYFVSGELNTYGYNWVSLPYSRTGMTYDQGYFDWCAETLASMGQSAPSAGYGLLIDDSQSGGGW